MLMKEKLLDEESPPFMLPEDIKSEESSGLFMKSAMINFLASKVYSGPTIKDIEEALSITSEGSGASEPNALGSQNLMAESDLIGKNDTKFTLKIKDYGNGALDDGFKWRKYGQKSIKNSLNPRSYYKCTVPRCGAKRQVERSSSDPNDLLITYEGMHFHFAYSHLLLSQPLLHLNQQPTKKAKESLHWEPQDKVQKSPIIGDPTVRPQGHMTNDVCPQGLLEDVVPLVVLKPWSSSAFSSKY